ncbi:Hypothetical protein (Fragment), partial [Durusdinium trenchii]
MVRSPRGLESSDRMRPYSSARSRSPQATWQYSQDFRPKLPTLFCMEGFQTKRFNVTFRARPELEVSGLPTYWDEYELLFIYWQVHGSRWTVCPRSDDNRKDLLNDVRSGDEVGMAYEEADAGVWSEYMETGNFAVTKGVRLRALDGSIPGELVGSPRGKRISRWRKEARERAVARGQMPKSLQDMKRHLEAHSEVEEVFLVPGAKELELVVSFRSPQPAEKAVEVGRGLLAGDPDNVDSLRAEQLQRLRAMGQGSYVSTRPSAEAPLAAPTAPEPVAAAAPEPEPAAAAPEPEPAAAVLEPEPAAAPEGDVDAMRESMAGMDLQELLIQQEVRQREELQEPDPSDLRVPARPVLDESTQKA